MHFAHLVLHLNQLRFTRLSDPGGQHYAKFYHENTMFVITSMLSGTLGRSGSENLSFHIKFIRKPNYISQKRLITREKFISLLMGRAQCHTSKILGTTPITSFFGAVSLNPSSLGIWGLFDTSSIL